MKKVVLIFKETLKNVEAYLHTERKPDRLQSEHDKPYMTCDESWVLQEGFALPCVLIVDGEDFLTVFDPEDKAVIMGIPKSKVTIRGR